MYQIKDLTFTEKGGHRRTQLPPELSRTETRFINGSPLWLNSSRRYCVIHSQGI